MHTMTDTRLVKRAALAVVTVAVFILTLCLLSSAQHVAGSLNVTGRSVTCDVTWVEPLANTSVTCHFPENVSQTRRDVAISFYKGMDWRDEEDILDCWWLSGRMDCNVRPGYSFNNMISHKLTLEIHQVSAKYIGGYACRLSNMNPSDIKPCELKIKPVGKTMCDVPSVPLNSRTSLTCYFPEDLLKTKADFKVHQYSSRGYEDDIVSCKWKEDYQFCNTIRGYEFDVTTVTNHVTVVIPNAQEDQEGFYSCHLTSSASVRYDNCSLTLVKVTSFCNISSVKETQATSLTCTFNGDVHATQKNFSQVRFDGVDSTDFPAVVLTFGIFVVMLIPVSLVIFILVFTYKRRILLAENVFDRRPLLQPEEQSNYPAKMDHEFWQKWVEATFPDLDSCVYFLPPVHVNREPMTRHSVSGQDVQVFQIEPRQADQSNHMATMGFEDSDARDYAVLHRFLLCLQRMCEQNKEVLVGLSQLQFHRYLGEPCYAATAKKLPLPATLPPDMPREWKQGHFDVLLIHRHYGLVTCEVKALDGYVNKQNIPQENITEETKKEIIKIIEEAITHLDKAKTMLSHLVSDIVPRPRITKAIVVPNLTVRQMLNAILEDPKLTQDLCRCLRTRDAADIAGVCLCSDQLSDPKTPCDVSSHVLRELGHWWQQRVAGAGPDSHMTSEVYKTLVARFCGSATTVSVPCTCPPRVSVKTLGQAVWCTGECYTAVITLFPEQLHLLNTAPPRLFMTGPPGTGKTVVLLMTGIKWLRFGHPVYIVSSWDRSRSACVMMYHLLLQTVNTQLTAGVSPGQPHLLLYDLYDGKDLEKAVNNLSQVASGGSLYVIADEVAPHWMSRHFQTLCDKLLTQVPRLHLWAACCDHGHAPAGWQEEYLTRPLHSLPSVVRDVEQDKHITKYYNFKPYSDRGVSDHTDGPPVTRLYHRGHGPSGSWPGDCVTCGREVASFLHSLRVGVTGNLATTSTTVTSTSGGTTQPCLLWTDVLVLCWDSISDDAGMVKGLKEASIPVRVMKDDDIEDVATARSDVVWVANGDRVRGLERKVVVCLEDDNNVRLQSVSTCTSQLVAVVRND